MQVTYPLVSSVRMRPEDWDLVSKMGAPVFNRGGWISLRFDARDNANWEYISAQVSRPGMAVDRTTAIRLALHAYCAEVEPGALTHTAELIRAALEWYAARLRAGG